MSGISIATDSADTLVQPTVKLQQAVRALVPGAVQGASSIIIGHPFDTIKTRMQARSADTKHSLFQTVRALSRDEGIIAFYRGVSPPLLITSTKRSLQLSVWEFLKGLPEPRDPNGFLATLRPAIVSPFGAGAIAGAFGTVLGCPMNVIKIQTQNVRREDTRNALTCIVKIAREDGFLGFYRGLHVQLMKDVSFAATYLGLYDLVSRTIETYVPPPPKRPGDVAVHHHKSTTFFAGLIASMATWIVLFPLDTAKTFVQARQPLRSLVTELTGMSLVAGLARMYKGCSAALLRAGPVSGITMVMYEYAKEAVATSTQAMPSKSTK